jgi:hypothetical protein
MDSEEKNLTQTTRKLDEVLLNCNYFKKILNFDRIFNFRLKI